MTSGTATARIGHRPAPAHLALIAASIILFCVTVPIHSALYGTDVLVALLLGAVLCAAPVLALPRPGLASVLFCASALCLSLAAGHAPAAQWPWPWSVPAMLVFVLLVLTVSAVHDWRRALLPWGVSLAGTVLLSLLRTDGAARGAAGTDLVVTTSLTGVAIVVGVLLAGRMRLGEELDRQRELSAAEHSRRLLVEERTRIARDLHDVIAHSTSLIQVQASTARYRLPQLPPEASAEFEDIAATARGSLAEMRRLLGVLRTEDETPRLTPQQGLEDIPALVETTRRAGVEVALRTEPPTAPPPPAVQIAAYRIVQEALSNAVRHASGAAIEVEQGIAEGKVTLRVRNGPPTAETRPAPSSGSGHGLHGMQERAALLDGTVEAGPAPDGGWCVRAVLPVETARDTDDTDGGS